MTILRLIRKSRLFGVIPKKGPDMPPPTVGGMYRPETMDAVKVKRL